MTALNSATAVRARKCAGTTAPVLALIKGPQNDDNVMAARVFVGIAARRNHCARSKCSEAERTCRGMIVPRSRRNSGGRDRRILPISAIFGTFRVPQNGLAAATPCPSGVAAGKVVERYAPVFGPFLLSAFNFLLLNAPLCPKLRQCPANNETFLIFASGFLAAAVRIPSRERPKRIVAQDMIAGPPYCPHQS